MESFSESVELHDKYQFEVKFTYPLDKTRPLTEYHVESFMFIPNNLCVNKRTYSREEFFNDMQKYIRFKTPAVQLRVMDQGESSPLAKLAATMERLANGGGAEAAKDYEERLKMFCSIMKSALRDGGSFLEKSKDDPNFKTLVENYLSVSAEIIGRLRDLKLSIQTPTVEQRHLKMYQLVDEFISLTVNKYRYRLMLFLGTLGTEPAAELKAKTIAAIRAEIEHRAANMYPSIPREDSDNEEMIYRESALKKIMASILFLKTCTQREGVLLEQIIFGFAAGLAMAFATGVAFLSRNFAQDFSLTFFIVLVVSYMFKDRMKEMSRGYLYSKLRDRMYDLRTDVYSALDRKVGVCKESFNFVHESALPPEVRKLRNKDYISELENGCLGEDIIQSRKMIKLYSGECSNIFSDFDVDGVVDIMRFNIRGFLEKMDNPAKELYMPASSGDWIVKIKGRRVYHINMIIKYGMEGCEDIYRRFRLVVSRNGVRRIEELPAGTTGLPLPMS